MRTLKVAHSKCTVAPISVYCWCAAPQHLKSWSEEAMAFAVEAVQEKKTIREAAAAYHVPRSTIGDRVSGRV